MFWEELLTEHTYFEWGFREAKKLHSVKKVEGFIKQMEHYSCMNKHASYMFSAAQNGAENALDIILKKGDL